MDINTTQELDSLNRQELEELLSLLSMLRRYLNDHIIKDLSETVVPLSKLAAAMACTDLVDVLEKSIQDPELDRALLEPPRVGVLGMIKALNDADVQKGMGIMLQLLRSMGKAAGGE
jgi:uncharacterized protein YjgD (DUF1641 family)